MNTNKSYSPINITKMKILKRVLIAIVLLVVLVLVVAAIAPKKYVVEREVIINQPTTEVFEYVKFLQNQDNFSTWANMDPQMEKTFEGTDGVVGFVSAWKSENRDVGRGEQEIMRISDGERIDYELRFFEPWEATNQAYILTENIGENETLVKWGFNGSMSYPSNLMLLAMNMDEMLGGDLEKGLDNLKIILEKY